MASLQELWERITRRLFIADFCLIIEIIFDRNEILRILSSVGLTYPGRRLSSLPDLELIAALGDEFYGDVEVGTEVIKILKKKVAPYADRIAIMPTKDVKAYLKEEINKSPDLRSLAILALALILDDREEMVKEFNWFLEKSLKRKPPGEVEQKQLESVNIKLEAMLKEKDEINKKLNEALALQKEENRRLMKDINELKKVNMDLQSEIARLSTQRSEPTEIGEIKHLEKGIEKILYLLEKSVQNENILLTFPERFETTFLKEFSEIKKQLEEMVSNEQKIYANIKQTIMEELRKYSQVAKSQTKEEVKKPTLERIAIFADAENLYRSARECYSGKISYEKLLSLVTGQNRHLAKAIAYVVKSPTGDPVSFISSLEKIGFEVKVKEPRYRGDGTAKANWDMGIALDILSLLDRIDTVVLASGDGDFVPLVKYIKSKGKRVEVYSFPKNTAYDLIEIADHFYPLDEKIAWM